VLHVREEVKEEVMTHDEFVGQVQARARLGSRGAAETAIRATLETLAERLEGGIADNIAAQLPQEIAHHLRADVPFTRMSLDEFFGRVHSREGEGVDRPEAVFHSRAVIEVLQEALSQGAVEKLRQQLPAEFTPLFEAGSRGQMRTTDVGARPAPNR
jgi:uncharacterized protein (DUF2267 family)